jgi:hypothetical protein
MHDYLSLSQALIQYYLNKTLNQVDQPTWTCLRKFDNDDRLAEHSLTFGEHSKQVSFTIFPATDLNWNIVSKCGHGFDSDTGCAEDILMRY